MILAYIFANSLRRFYHPARLQGTTANVKIKVVNTTTSLIRAARFKQTNTIAENNPQIYGTRVPITRFVPHSCHILPLFKTNIFKRTVHQLLRSD
jgi:hypothetical protein